MPPITRRVAYTIKPKDSLLHLLKPYTANIFSYHHSRPVVWIVQQSGRQILDPLDWDMAVKMLYLVDFRSRAVQEKSNAVLKIADEVCGEAPYKETMFDKSEDEESYILHILKVLHMLIWSFDKFISNSLHGFNMIFSDFCPKFSNMYIDRSVSN